MVNGEIEYVPISSGEAYLRAQLGCTIQQPHAQIYADNDFVMLEIMLKPRFRTMLFFSRVELNAYEHNDVTGIHLQGVIGTLADLLRRYTTGTTPWVFADMSREKLANTLAAEAYIYQNATTDFAKQRISRLVIQPSNSEDIVIGRIAINRYTTVNKYLGKQFPVYAPVIHLPKEAVWY